MINKEIEYRIGQVILLRGTISSIAQNENSQPTYTVRLANGSTSNISQQQIAGITTDVPNDKAGDEDEDS